jgi:hypothetical protein
MWRGAHDVVMVKSFSITRTTADQQPPFVRPTSQFTFSVIGEISETIFHQIASCLVVE